MLTEIEKRFNHSSPKYQSSKVILHEWTAAGFDLTSYVFTPLVLTLSRLLYSIVCNLFPLEGQELPTRLAEAQSRKKQKKLEYRFRHITKLPTEALFLDTVVPYELSIVGFLLSVFEFDNAQR
jgi:hypothetical protein